MSKPAKTIRNGIFLFTGIAALFLYACTAPGPATNTTTAGTGTVYSTQYAYSPDLYMQFMCKEIEPIANELTTQMMLAQNVVNGSYPSGDAIASAENSISIVDDCINDTDVMQPPQEYEERRTATLTLMQNAKSSLEAYRDALQESTINMTKIKNARDIMQADYVALTGEFNAYFK